MTEREKQQIEEMADEIRRIRESYFGQADYLFAMKMYEAGYRKQSEGEWKIMKMGDGERVRTCSSCLISQSVNVYKGKVMFRYCPYCGAKMSGGME